MYSPLRSLLTVNTTPQYLCRPSHIASMRCASPSNDTNIATSATVIEPPRRFPSGYVNGKRPAHHLNDSKSKFHNPWPSFRYQSTGMWIDVSFLSLPSLQPRYSRCREDDLERCLWGREDPGRREGPYTDSSPDVGCWQGE